MKQRLLKWLSQFTDRRIPAGTGVTIDDSLVLDKPVSQNQIEEARKVGKMAYVLRDPESLGEFEMVGYVRKGDVSMVQLRHVLTGTTFNVTRSLTDLIFESKARK